MKYPHFRLYLDEAVKMLADSVDESRKFDGQFPWIDHSYNTIFDDVNIQSYSKDERIDCLDITDIQFHDLTELMAKMEDIQADLDESDSRFYLLDPRWTDIVEIAKRYLENSKHTFEGLIEIAKATT